MVRITSLLLAATLGVGVLSAQQSINVEVKATAPEQITYARALSGDVMRARTEDQRRAAVTRASAAYQIVRANWPGDARSYLISAFEEADLFINVRAPQNAVEILTPLRDRLRGNDNEPALLRRLGVAFGLLQDDENAEKLFRLAVAKASSPRYAKEALLTHRAAAQFYSHSGRGAEAARELEALMRHGGISEVDRALAGVEAIRAHLQARDHASARAVLPEVAGIVQRAKYLASPDIARVLEDSLTQVTQLVSK